MTYPLAAFHAARAGGRAMRITCFGSSTTAGYGASRPEASYPAVMRERLLPACPGGLSVDNLGVSGASAEEMDGDIAAVIATAPHLALWQTGSNDVTRPVPLARFVALTRSGLGRLLAAGMAVVLMDQQYSTDLERCPPFPRYREALHRLAEAADIPVFPRYALMRRWCAEGRGSIESLSPDGTHMTDPGYRMLGQAVADWLLQQG